MPRTKKKPKNTKKLVPTGRFNPRLYALLVLGLAALGVLILTTRAATNTPAYSKLGVFRGSGRPDNVAEYEKWAGRNVAYVLDFTGSSGVTQADPWSSIENPGWVCGRWANTRYNPIFSVAILPTDNLTLAAGARGDYNAHWKKFGETMVARGCGDDVLRLGWEFNGGFYNWTIWPEEGGSAEAYAAYWRQIVTTLRSVPGTSFKFDWCPLRGKTTSTVTQAYIEKAYPGDAYVDFIGLDAYDTAAPGKTGDARWQEQLTRPVGLQWQRDFAKLHGKPVTYPEWGLTVRPKDKLGGGDNPYYIQKMYEWFNALPASGGGSLGYHMYFEVDASDASHRLMLGQFPNSAAKFKYLF